MPDSYKIPQNVDLEDKIFGPFTLKQFLYILGAGVVTFFSFSTFWSAAPAVFILIAFFTWVVAGAFVFVRPNDQPFSKFAFSFLWFSLKPNRRFWKRIPSLGEIEFFDKAIEKAEPKDSRPSAEEVRSRLQRLAHVVDTRGWSDIDEDEADIASRVTSGEAKPKFNIMMSEAEQPEDILAREEGAKGSDRATAELERMLKMGVSKPLIKKRRGQPSASE